MVWLYNDLLICRWLLINSTDPDGMLQWFTEKLLDAEKKGMKVHVLGHISPGDDADCFSAWTVNYKKIALRYVMLEWLFTSFCLDAVANILTFFV